MHSDALPSILQTPLAHAVAAAFAPNSPLAASQQRYQDRPEQLRMALHIAKAIDERHAVVVEAGTGTGKTFAYLIPILLSGQSALISTASKALQDQLFQRDLPHMLRTLGIPARSALLKGRANYLCLWRMQQARKQNLSSNALAQLVHIERWSRSTETGDFAEVSSLPEHSALQPWISSTRDNCLGQDCPAYQDCFVLKARNEALQADITVINHHLFFADMNLREEGFGQLLPEADIVVLDEAHQLNEIGVQFLGRSISSTKLLELCRDTLVHGEGRAQGLVDWRGLVSTLEYATRELRLVIGKTWESGSSSQRLRWTEITPDTLNPASWQQGLQDLSTALNAILAALDTVTEMGPDYRRLYERADELYSHLTLFQKAHDPSCGVRWLEVAQHWHMVQAPLDIAASLRRYIYPEQAKAEAAPKAPNSAEAPFDLPALTPLTAAPDSAALTPPEAAPKAWIFTSATLGDASNIQWFTQPCGLEQAEQLRLASPFNYPEQAVLYIPTAFPEPKQGPAHSLAVAQLASQAALHLGGKTLVLTTTTRALRLIAQTLRQTLATSSISVLEQGVGSKQELIAALRQGQGSPGSSGCVLVATASLWEGIDIAGDALQCVLIDKLPFPPPSDPMVEAHSQLIQAAGRSPFQHYAMPEAAVMLKQGAGRLIRSETDRGALIICDSRLALTQYGKRLQQALPPMRKLDTEAELFAYLQHLQAGTTSQPAGK